MLICVSAPSASGEYSFHVTQAVSMLVSSLAAMPTPAPARPESASACASRPMTALCCRVSKWQPSWLLPARQYDVLGSLKGEMVLRWRGD